ncbi:hypothetical protein BASA81_002488 [Batrachochytrium salamandrivorans]|nr:hypothetical protein BASA81_002488 [Batrachochytrium salamandrivorans]
MPFAKGTLCQCSFPGAAGGVEMAQVKILQHRRPSSSSSSEDEYYIHLEGNDPRLDEWVPASRLVASDLDPNPLPLARTPSHKRLRRPPVSEDGEEPASENKIWHHRGGGHGELHAKVRNVDRVWIGNHLIDCWYYSPYPLPEGETSTLYVCQETFKYVRSPQVFARHVRRLREANPQPISPPGPLIYHEPGYLSVYRVEGTKERLYCQNLCLLGKLFLDHKTLYFDPSHFYFFVLVDHPANQFVGYFSKEKDSTEDFNLACILTLPPFQRRGYGKFIISLSYELSKREGKQQTPEKPLSDLGKLSYRAYWSCVLLQVLLEACERGARPSVAEISKQTGIKLEDTVSTLQALGCIKFFKRCFVLAVSLEQIEALWKPFADKNFTSTFCKLQYFV